MDEQQPGPPTTDEARPDSEQPSWQFNPEDTPPAARDAGAAAIRHSAIESVEWTASEYIAHHKTPGWFVMLGVATAALAIVAYVITRGDLTSSIMIMVVGLFFGIVGARPPRVLDYAVSESGIRIDKKFYSYGEFKSFAILDEGGISSILLMPLKRWMPPLTIYYAPEDEQKIVNVLSTALPIEHRQQDALDRLMRRVRF